MRTEIWGALVKKNPAYEDAPVGFRVMAVKRELERESWAQDGDIETLTSYTGADEAARPTPRPSPGESRSGNTRPGAGEAGSMPMMLSVNGHGTTATSNLTK